MMFSDVTTVLFRDKKKNKTKNNLKKGLCAQKLPTFSMHVRQLMKHILPTE